MCLAFEKKCLKKTKKNPWYHCTNFWLHVWLLVIKKNAIGKNVRIYDFCFIGHCNGTNYQYSSDSVDFHIEYIHLAVM